MTDFEDCWPFPCRDYHATSAHQEDPCLCRCHRPANDYIGQGADQATTPPPEGHVPGLDTLMASLQTDDMRSTTGLPHDFGQVCDCIDCVGCDHKHVEPDDDGLFLHFNRCADCDQVVVLTAPDEDGQSFWEVM